jgi:hypothetical protein
MNVEPKAQLKWFSRQVFESAHRVCHTFRDFVCFRRFCSSWYFGLAIQNTTNLLVTLVTLVKVKMIAAVFYFWNAREVGQRSKTSSFRFCVGRRALKRLAPD